MSEPSTKFVHLRKGEVRYETDYYITGSSSYVCMYDTISINTNAALASLSDGLVAYYPFNGNANDESGNGNNGTVNPSVSAVPCFKPAEEFCKVDQ